MMSRVKIASLVLPAAAMFFVGCATQPSDTASAEDAMKSEKMAMEAEKLQAERARLQAEADRLAADRAALEAERNKPAMAMNDGADGLFPPNAQPGECYARVLTPAQYSTSTDRVLKREASERIDIIPAKYQTVSEKVLVREASTKLVVVPAVYETVTERVMISPASKKIVEVPATYKTVTEKVLDKPAHTAWKRGPASAQSGKVLKTLSGDSGLDTGEIMCLVEVPATYKTITRKAVATPARTNTVEIPAKYGTVKKRVVKKPATTREVVIPAEYKTVKVTKEVQPAQEKRIPIPEEYATVTKTKKVTEETLEWRSVLCEVNMTKANVSSLQRALRSAGRYKGPIDGIMGSGTLRASSSYAKSKGLPYGSNYITNDVIKSLGLNI